VTTGLAGPGETERPARVIFLGSGAFGVPILDALVGAPEIDLVGVVSAPDRPIGRSGVVTAVPVATRARALGLPLLQPERVRAPDAIEAITGLRPHLGVLADYGQIVPAALLDVPSRGILNVHPSLLPRHRGASPIPATILAGDRETGVTLIRMDAGLDTGPIVAVDRWPLGGDELAPDLERRAAEAGAALVSRTIGPWLRGEIAARRQASEGVTLTRPLRRDDGRLDPSRPALEPPPGPCLPALAGVVRRDGRRSPDRLACPHRAGRDGDRRADRRRWGEWRASAGDDRWVAHPR
jgi:methionyl-tRNA formyltransferase